jgi:hypothetical protein
MDKCFDVGLQATRRMQIVGKEGTGKASRTTVDGLDARSDQLYEARRQVQGANRLIVALDGRPSSANGFTHTRPFARPLIHFKAGFFLTHLCSTPFSGSYLTSFDDGYKIWATKKGATPVFPQR